MKSIFFRLSVLLLLGNYSSAQELPKPGLPVPKMIMDENGSARYGEIWDPNTINGKLHERNATLAMLALPPTEFFRITDASTGGRTVNDLYRFFVIRGQFFPPETGKYTFSYHGRDGGIWFGEGDNAPGDLLIKVFDNGRYGRTRFAAKSFDLEKGKPCSLMMVYPQYKGDLTGGARMGYRLERDGEDPLTVGSIPLNQLVPATAKQPERIVEIWRNASTGLKREKVAALWGTVPTEVKTIGAFEFAQELHGRAAFKDSLFVIRGYFIPPKTSRYTMTLSKRVQGKWGESGLVGKAELWFQSDPKDKKSLRLVASLKEKVGGINTTENEKGFSLMEGERYYFEYLHEYGAWQRRTGMAGGFRNSDGDEVVRMDTKHFVSLTKAEIEAIRSKAPQAPPLDDGKVVKSKTDDVKLTPGAVILASLTPPLEIVENKSGKKLPISDLKVGKVIKEGYEIKVGPGGEVVLVFSNGTVTTLRQNTSMVVTAFQQEKFLSAKVNFEDIKEEAGVSRTMIDLTRGQMVVEAKKLKKGSNFEITTRLGVAGIRGTRFLIDLDERGAGSLLTRIVVTEGKVYCKPLNKGKDTGREFNLEAGEKFSYDSTATLEDLLELKPLQALEAETQGVESIVLASRKKVSVFSLADFFKAWGEVNPRSQSEKKLSPFERLRQRGRRR